MKDYFIIYLGGSISQTVNIEYLKKKKYKIILIDQNPNCYCRKYCDFFFNISQTNTKKILLYLKNFFYNKKFEVIDCIGVAHYSYPTVNKIKGKYVKNSLNDKFLMHKFIQKKKLKASKLSPDFIILPDKKKLFNRSKYYWNKIYNFYKTNNYSVFVKSDIMHQGQGVIELSEKISKLNFIKKYQNSVLKLFKNTKVVYLEKKVDGRLLNVDFIKKSDGKVIFLPIIYRDKVILEKKKKFLSVFQYLNNSNIIKKNQYIQISNILKKIYKGKSIFGTIDAIVNENKIEIIEMSPHFHNSKIFDFLNDRKVIDIYINKLSINTKKEDYQRTNKGGYIYVNDENKESKKLLKFVKKNSTKTQVDYIDTKNRKIFLQKHAFVKKKFHIIYFKTKSIKNLLKISNYLEKNKNLLYS